MTTVEDVIARLSEENAMDEMTRTELFELLLILANEIKTLKDAP